MTDAEPDLDHASDSQSPSPGTSRSKLPNMSRQEPCLVAVVEPIPGGRCRVFAFIVVSTGTPPKVWQITAKLESTCMSCEEPVHVGDSVWWTPGVGVWHTDCKAPQNLQHHWDAAEKKRKAGL